MAGGAQPLSAQDLSSGNLSYLAFPMEDIDWYKDTNLRTPHTYALLGV
jgi:hypothetical protein